MVHVKSHSDAEMMILAEGFFVRHQARMYLEPQDCPAEEVFCLVHSPSATTAPCKKCSECAWRLCPTSSLFKQIEENLLVPVDEVELGVGPVDFRQVIIERETVGPVDVVLDDDLPAARGAVHPRALDLGNLPPVRPVHVTTNTATTHRSIKGQHGKHNLKRNEATFSVSMASCNATHEQCVFRPKGKMSRMTKLNEESE